MIIHQKTIEGISVSPESLAKTISYSNYDNLSFFIEELSEELRKQGDKECLEGKNKLSLKLYETSEKLYRAYVDIKELSKINPLENSVWDMKPSLKDLAFKISHLNYDQTDRFIQSLKKGLNEQINFNSKDKKYKKASYYFYLTSLNLNEAHLALNEI